MNFSDNIWYHIYMDGDTGNALQGTSLFGNSSDGPRMVGSVFKSTAGLDDKDKQRYQRWQVMPIDDDYYILRTDQGSQNGFMSTFFNSSRAALSSRTLVRMIRNTVADESVFWNISQSEGGKFVYSLSNKANGSDWNMGLGGITETDDGTEAQMQTKSSGANLKASQKFQFEAISEINDDKYSKSALFLPILTSSLSTSSGASGTPVTSGASRPSDSSNSNKPAGSDADTNNTSSDNSSGGLSTGAKAGIGAGVGLAALIALVVLGLFLFRRKRRQQQTTLTSPTDSTAPYAHGDTFDEHNSPGAARYAHVGSHEKSELSNTAFRHELPSEPAELPASDKDMPNHELPGHDAIKSDAIKDDSITVSTKRYA